MAIITIKTSEREREREREKINHTHSCASIKGCFNLFCHVVTRWVLGINKKKKEKKQSNRHFFCRQ